MEGKKKKKNRKKEGNRAKSSDSLSATENQTKASVSLPTAEEGMLDQDQSSAPEENHDNKTPSLSDNQRVGVSESDVEQERLKNLEIELHEEIKKLKDENEIWLQKEGSWEDRIKILQSEVVFCIQIKANLEEKIDDLQNTNASLTLKVTNLEDSVKKMKDFIEYWQLKVNAIKERLCRFDGANEGLQMQVRELRESRDGLTEENKQLIQSISMLESRVRHLETVETSHASAKIFVEEKSHAASANTSVKLDEQNGEADSEVTKIHVESLHHAVDTENSTDGNNLDLSSSPAKFASLYQKRVLESTEKEQALVSLPDRFNANGFEDLGTMEQLRQIQLMGLDDSRISEDVVSVPLDDIVQELSQSSAKIESDSAVPLSDAPLIGAPFRLISFVARYVSGADLVNADKTTAGR